MKVRLYTNTKTRWNENWNPYGILETAPHKGYKDSLITGKPNGHYESGSNDFQQEFYKKIGIDIVTETAFNYPYPSTTEKILRPLINKRMFVLVGAPHTLEFIKTKGFKTFEPFIDETYDTIDNPFDRIDAIFAEIDRLVTLPIDSIRKAMLQYTDTLESNFQTVINLEAVETEKIKQRLSNI
tara:strand:+ start:2613 stop:3161 length:549 start_codon:yes stop_codon:yes gene_type:complete